MIYFTSDTHFFHNSIIQLAKRPFVDLQEMHEQLISNWNTRISIFDTVYILGDFAYKSSSLQQIYDILKQLNGKKHLIIGNHDDYLRNPDFNRSYFESIENYDYIYYKKQKIIMFHYPILEWDGFYRKSIHLYGHVHKSTNANGGYDIIPFLGKRAINVSVEFNNYYPWSVEEILDKVKI